MPQGSISWISPPPLDHKFLPFLTLISEVSGEASHVSFSFFLLPHLRSDTSLPPPVAGKYGVFVPFYNAIFSGKVGRMNILAWNDIQELDLSQDRVLVDVLKGFRGGFVSEWQGKSDDLE
jgi:hypothetical protein